PTVSLRSAATPESRRAVGPDADRVASSTCRSGPATPFTHHSLRCHTWPQLANRRLASGETISSARVTSSKKPRIDDAGLFDSQREQAPDYLILASLNSTCLR